MSTSPPIRPFTPCPIYPISHHHTHIPIHLPKYHIIKVSSEIIRSLDILFVSLDEGE